MKRGRLFFIAPMVWVLSAAVLILSGITWFLGEKNIAYIECGVSVILVIVAIVKLVRQQKDIVRYMHRVTRLIDEKDHNALSQSPLPIAVITADQQVLWHNTNFQTSVADGRSFVGKHSDEILPGIDVEGLKKAESVEISLHGRHYTVYLNSFISRGKEVFVLYYLDITELRNTAEEYAATRPVAMLIYIDNLEELVQRSRDSERAKITGQVENALEDWLGNTTGVLRKYDDDRFLTLVEKRHLKPMIEARFDILDRVRSIPLDNNLQITLSIGIGEGNDFNHAERNARQAIDMALGRGGDQAVLHTQSGFEFYGGLSKGVEKRTKVRTRIMASALQDMIAQSDNVLVMGHRFSDLDCCGSGLVLTMMARALGKPAHLIVSRRTTLAEELFVRFEKAGYSDLWASPNEASSLLKPKTLLIVTDTQNPAMLESRELYEKIETVAVIDHHRKMNDSINNAVLFFHESYASSACEMVAEIAQYVDGVELNALQAEALLSGIMLDTRNFVMSAGVRTFEAAAYLRKQGADTVSVKRIFAGSMELHRQKSEIMSTVQFYRQTAIAYATEGANAELRIACSQAADELLSIKDTVAAFALFEDNGAVNISARSYGDFNVQLVMEYLGGGGHMTMAGAQVKGASLNDVLVILKQGIDRYYTENVSKK